MRLMLVLLLVSAACAQQDDVAAAARANKDKKQNQAPAKKVYTNEDLGYGNPSDSKSDRDIDVSKVPREQQGKARQAAQQILQQKQQIARLQEHFDKLQKIQAERANLQTPPQLTPAECSKEPERCEGPRAFTQDLSRTEKQLESAKKKLEDLQDAARKQGFPRSVYDP
jgi:hypothetical protein